MVSVTGDVDLAYTRPGLQFNESTRPVHMPALTTIGGHLNISSPAAIPNQVIFMDVGLDALSSIGGDLTISVQTSNVSLSGMGALATVPGNLSIVTGQGDTTMWSFMNGLLTVNGDVTMDIGFTATGVLASVTFIGGHLNHLDGNILATGSASDGYASLVSVGGDLTYTNAQVIGGPGHFLFASLMSVGGTLTYDDISSKDSVLFGAPGLQVNGLTVSNSPALTSMGADNITVINNGPITITGNSNLCSTTVDAWLLGQVGWAGVPTISGNDDGC